MIGSQQFALGAKGGAGGKGSMSVHAASWERDVGQLANRPSSAFQFLYVLACRCLSCYHCTGTAPYMHGYSPIHGLHMHVSQSLLVVF